MVIVPLDHNRPVVMLNINRPGRRIVLINLILLLFIVAIGITTLATISLPTICQGDSSANKDHKKCNYKYFQYVVFHLFLLFQLNLHRLDGASSRKVYMGLGESMKPENPGRLTPTPIRPTF